MTDYKKEFGSLSMESLLSVVGGKGRYGASGNRFVHCGAGIVGGAVGGAIGGPWGVAAGALVGGLANCH